MRPAVIRSLVRVSSQYNYSNNCCDADLRKVLTIPHTNINCMYVSQNPVSFCLRQPKVG